MNENKLSTVIFGWVVILAFTYGGYTYGKYLSDFDTKSQLQEVINWNTKQIHSLGVAASTDSHNAEILIQILNKMQGNPVKPISRFKPYEDIVNERWIEDNDSPVTFDQVRKDQREVDRSIRALATHDIVQSETLINILEKTKENIDK